MTLSVVFLLTTSPNVIYFLKIDDWVSESEDARSEARLRLGFAITNLLYYTNNATNFFLVLASQKPLYYTNNATNFFPVLTITNLLYYTNNATNFSPVLAERLAGNKSVPKRSILCRIGRVSSLSATNFFLYCLAERNDDMLECQ